MTQPPRPLTRHIDAHERGQQGHRARHLSETKYSGYAWNAWDTWGNGPGPY
jgi:hypothetical protein